METKPGDLEGLAQTTVAAMEPEKKEEDTTPKASDPAPPVVDAPAVEASAVEAPAAVTPTAEPTVVEPTAAEPTAAEAPTPEASTTEASTTEASTTEASTTEASTAEVPTVEAPAPAAKATTTEAPATQPTTAAATTTEAPSAEAVPDPEEDDLDDLDDMLDEFSPSKPEPIVPAVPSGPGRPQPEAAAAEGVTDDDFAKQLQAGMADLLGELETSPDMQAQFEQMMKELSGAPTAGETAKDVKGSDSKSVPSGTASADVNFQATIEKTMERMRLSGDNATAAAASSDTDDFMAEMMKAMQGSGLDGGEGSEEDFSKMIMGMMEQLTNKEILYEPMKELDDKFPDWLEKNGAKTKEDDLKRYKEQQVYVREIVSKFEEKTYADSNAADREYIVERMQKMQAAGSPPPDLVGDMAAAQEAFGAPDEGCPTQ